MYDTFTISQEPSILGTSARQRSTIPSEKESHSIPVLPLKSSNKMKRSVQFRNIELIEIGIVLGDNPSPSTGGPPMSLGWEPLRRSQYELDYYEEYRPRRKDTRRELIISGRARTKFFLRNGYSMDEIDEATVASQCYRNQMTISKILDPKNAEDEATMPKDRFASLHESEMHFIQEHRMPRRNSCETPSSSMRASSRRMPRRQSNDFVCPMPIRQLSKTNDTSAPNHGGLRAPVRARPSASTGPDGEPLAPRRWSSDEITPLASPATERKRIQRHHSSPAQPRRQRNLQPPVRLESPAILNKKVLSES
eukprot:Nitzschia sp. Nitz4//scaffold126_size65214//58606//59640//NITZ4_006167-RA/size65214-snap-gene-0.54-mRNA-1//1//CDS//3329534722//3017//frame0